MGVEWNNDANLDLSGLLKSWKRAEKQYREQVEEAKRSGTPWDQMFGCATQLHECIHNLERALSKTQNDRTERQPPTVTMERTRRIQTAARRRAEKRGGCSLQ
jgi:hypothetical protein